MPPKRSKSKKVAKGEQSAVVDCLSTEEMTKDQLVEHFVRLREELDREREEKSFFQLERDKIREFWEISKRSLEEANAQLRNQQREKEEAEECHRVEITVFKQKLKNVVSEQQNAMAKMKMEGVATAMLVQNRNMEAELGLRRDVSSLHANCREKEHHTHNSLRELQLKHQVELMDLASSYDRRIKETEEKYLKNLQSLLEAEGKQRQAEIKKLDEQMKSQMVTLKEEHDRAHREAEEYYSAVQRKLLEDQKLLKREMAEATKVQAKAGRELSAAEQENTRLREAMQEAEHKLIQAQEQAEQSRKKKARMKLEQERDELLRTQADTILELQQKIGLKEQLLQRKMEALTEAVENREAQLYAVLSAANLDPTTASDTTKKLQDILDSGDVTIKALQRELSASCED
ncbi:dynein regulatory complex subunit 4-like isoform X3 [Takifugu flavidus]|uniref:dynein regulatory complex subunit 4-like isoform X3 n=1 Tax=Takifugu flavidus TaxID=433684 RepID=UPI00254443F4|nr:dynein regulatory complex subunit 4-like isoform X3 [Takifugu flavidus]